jgi:lipoprotein signal peptidase
MSKLSCVYIFSRYLSVEMYVLLSTAITALFVFLFLKNIARSRVGDLGLLLFIAGASVNTLERLKSGCIWDYISFFNLFYFNVQDLLVTVGIILMIWTILKIK